MHTCISIIRIYETTQNGGGSGFAPIPLTKHARVVDSGHHREHIIIHPPHDNVIGFLLE